MQAISIDCGQHQLAASLFRPEDPATLKGAVLIAPATGIKRDFYRAFAKYLAEQGYGVLTFNNQGIGDSLQGKLSHCPASLQSWGEQDMPAALDALMQAFPGVPYHLVGHSAGGQLAGLMPNAKHLASICNFACSSGSLRNMHWPFKLNAHVFMNLFMPLSNALFGQANNQWLGMGQALPKQAAKQWRQWCNGSGYVKVAFGRSIHRHYYNQLTCPSLWLHADDDAIAINANVQEMAALYSRSPATVRTLTPRKFGLQEIGHMKFFSRRCQTLWPIALQWLDKHN